MKDSVIRDVTVILDDYAGAVMGAIQFRDSYTVILDNVTVVDTGFVIAAESIEFFTLKNSLISRAGAGIIIAGKSQLYHTCFSGFCPVSYSLTMASMNGRHKDSRCFEHTFSSPQVHR